MTDLEKQREQFKNHIATFTDYGNIKILDFKNPNSSNYRIRFLFEEDYCRLHISGDLGELIATNYNNMTYEKFSDFVDSTGYIKGKIDCHSRNIYFYDEDKAREDIVEHLKKYELCDLVAQKYDYGYKSEEDAVNDFIDDVMQYFDTSTGITSTGYELLSEVDSNIWESIGDFGKEETGILDLYMLAFKLAQKDLKERENNA